MKSRPGFRQAPGSAATKPGLPGDIRSSDVDNRSELSKPISDQRAMNVQHPRQASHIVLLRGINVGGNRSVPMAKLKAWLESLALGPVHTLLQSGNAVISAKGSPHALEAQLEKTAPAALGVQGIQFFIRSAGEWEQIIAANPFPAEAKNDPARLVYAALKSAPTAAQFEALQAAIPGRERVEGGERGAYLQGHAGINPKNTGQPGNPAELEHGPHD